MPSGGYKIRNQSGIHFITFAVVEWVDVFTRSTYCDIVVESLKFCIEEKGMRIHAWIIMSNHLHLIASAKDGCSLSNILRDFKKYTSVRIVDAIKNNNRESRRRWMMVLFKEAGLKNARNSSYQFWRQDNRPIQLSTNEMIEQRLNYLHNNPVATGIFENGMDYIYSSAKDYADLPGLIKIERL